MSNNLAEVMKVFTQSMTDSSPGVRFAAIRTLRAMSVDLPPLTPLSDGNKPVKQVTKITLVYTF